VKLKFSIFYSLIVLFLLIGGIALYLTSDFLTGYLKEYEDSLPKYDAEEVFAAYFKKPDIDLLLEISGYELTQFETKTVLANYYTRLLYDKEITYSRASSGVDSKTMSYNVKAGGTKFAEFTLVLSEERTPHDFDLYVLGSIRLQYRASEAVEITLPSDSSAFVNGIQLNANYITEDGIPYGNTADLPEELTPITFKTYAVNGLLVQPTIRVVDRFGQNCELTNNNGQYRAEITYDEALAEEYSDYIIKAIKTYSDMTHGDASKGAAQKYYEKGSNIYSYIATLENYFDWEHSGSIFENIRTGEFYAYDENTFSCRISFVQRLPKAGQEDYVDPLDLTLFLRKNAAGTYLIFAQHTNI
jgi:hypothetical protein